MPEPAVVAGTPPATPAPSSPTSGTPASAPVTSTIATTPQTPPASERPTDVKSLSKFMQNLDAGKTADATTPQSPLVADPAAATTAPPTTPIVPGAPESMTAAPPPETWPKILENARTKAVADYKQSLGPLANFTPEQKTWFIDMAARMNDPVAFHRWFGEQLAGDPRFSQQVQPAANTKPQPDVEIRDDRGQVVGMGYSAAKQEELLAWNSQQVEGKFTKLLQPFQQERDQRIKQEQINREQKILDTRADGVMTQVEKILRIDKLPPNSPERFALGQKLLDEMSRTPNAVEAALMVFERDVVPSLERKGQQAAVDTNLKKAAANTANGTGGSSKPTIGPKSTPKEIAAFLAQNEG